MQVTVMNRIIEAGTIAHGSEGCSEKKLGSMTVHTKLDTVTKSPLANQENPPQLNQTDNISRDQGFGCNTGTASEKETSAQNVTKYPMNPKTTTTQAEQTVEEISHHTGRQAQQSTEQTREKNPSEQVENHVDNPTSCNSSDMRQKRHVAGDDNSTEKVNYQKLHDKFGNRPPSIAEGMDNTEMLGNANTVGSNKAGNVGKDALPVLAIIAASVREDGHHTVPSKGDSSGQTIEHKEHDDINYANLNLIANAASNKISEKEIRAARAMDINDADSQKDNNDDEINDSEMAPQLKNGQLNSPLLHNDQNESTKEGSAEGGDHAVSDEIGVCREQDPPKKTPGADTCKNTVTFPSRLESYEIAWKKIKANTTNNTTKIKNCTNTNAHEKDVGVGGGEMVVGKESIHSAGADALVKRKALEEFKYAISQNTIKIQNDTSITGRFSFGLKNGGKTGVGELERKRKAYGLELSTEEACQKEQYEIIKPSSPILTDNSTTTVTWDSNNYYQSWDPAARKFTPKRRLYDGDTVTTTSNPTDQRSVNQSSPYGNSGRAAGLLPLGAAAAGTRAALLSFMSAKTGLVSSAMPMSRFKPSDLGMSGLAGGSFIPSGIMPGTTIELPTEQSSFNVPEKVIIQPNRKSKSRRQFDSGSSNNTVTGRIVGDNDSGGKRIENCSSTSTPSRNKNRSGNNSSRDKARNKKRKKISGRDDSSSFEESAASYKRSRNAAWDTDEGTGDMTASVRRSKRKTVPKKHDS